MDVLERTPAQVAGVVVPDLKPELEITCRLDGGDVIVSAGITLTAPIWATFPDDVVRAPVHHSHIGGLMWEASEWLPEGFDAADIIRSAIGGLLLATGEYVGEYLRRHAEQALNDYCAWIRESPQVAAVGNGNGARMAAR